jgi:hypothetical protein
MTNMSLTTHIAVLSLLVLDLLVGGSAVERYWGHFALTAF